MEARGPGQPWGKTKPSKTPAVVYDIKEWIHGLEEASNGGPNKMMTLTTEPINGALTHNGGQSQRSCR